MKEFSKLRFVYDKCKKYILFYNGDKSRVLEQPFYEWCSLCIQKTLIAFGA